jgi:signal recognition particle subunit SRP19
MSHARVEEISDSSSAASDSDPDIMDPTQIISARSALTKPSKPSPPPPNPHLLAPSQLPPPNQQSSSSSSSSAAAPPARSRTWAVVYPIYFDASRSRLQGRRVPSERAVKNPLAKALADAVRGMGLNSVFEPGKTHPKDWANPGRVRVDIRESGGIVKNSTSLLSLLSCVCLSTVRPSSGLACACACSHPRT